MRKLHKYLQKYYYLKLWYGRASSYTGIPMDLVEKFALVTLLLAHWGIDNTPAVISVFAVSVCLITFLGYWDIKMRNAHLEQEINNQLNPQLMQIHKHVLRRNKRI